ncbi:putative ABC transport system permease protein [Pseudoclavibacter chungangensis]|nr:ABC transporter permease [Pseudoclavibacter chungangensis]NYJ67021.1 putative ABC transport system permease protein [Pseudoclavibacter chungangensis]
MKFFTGAVGGLLDAWDEIRVHKTRLILSLLGVLLAVCALTTVTGIGRLTESGIDMLNNQMSGPDMSYQISASGGDATETAERFESAMTEISERYEITYVSRSLSGQVQVQYPDGVAPVAVTAVDHSYGDMRSVPVTEGSWFATDDADRLAPAVVISNSMWEGLGSPDLATHPTLEILAPTRTTAVVVGVYSAPEFGFSTSDQLYMLYDSYDRISTTETDGSEVAAASAMGGAGSQMSYVVWLPPAIGEDLGWRIKTDLQSSLGPSVAVEATRTDAGAYGGGAQGLTTMIAIVSSIVLVIGVVGYINLAILSVDNRVREIGIRRSFGATGGRVFVAVLLESVVGTLIAGMCGIALAALILSNTAVQQAVSLGAFPDGAPFPTDAAWMGLIISLVVGVISGIIPAFIATRIKVIDALRL